VRFFPLKDRSGVYVPNTYIMVMDYFGVNYDYNDNVYVVQNIRPEELPATPVGLTAIATTGGVQLNWGDNTDAGLVGYHVYRSTSATSGFQRITSQPLTVSQLLDATMTGATKVYYRVAAVTATATSMFASTATA
jgi:hypothetical protein